jgi:hypothetical protein
MHAASPLRRSLVARAVALLTSGALAAACSAAPTGSEEAEAEAEAAHTSQALSASTCEGGVTDSKLWCTGRVKACAQIVVAQSPRLVPLPSACFNFVR